MARSPQGRRMASITAPNVAATVAHGAGAGELHTPRGQAANICKHHNKPCKEMAAHSQAHGKMAPSMHKGVTHKVTQGMARALANNPTSDTC